MRNVWIVAAGFLVLSGTGCNWLKSRDHQNQGVAYYKAAKYGKAAEEFKQAIDLDPSSPNPRLFLATSYMSQWIPGAESPENTAFANNAKAEFMKVLDKDPNNTVALASLASIAFQSASSLPPDKKAERLDEAARWNHKVIDADPKNKEAYYTLGVISWSKWYPALMTARAGLRMKPEDPGPIKDKKVKEELKAKYSALVDEGIANLNKALEIDKEYEDAMSYMNLMVRERADLVDTPEEYKKQIDIADAWLQKVLDTKKIKAARQPTNNGIVQDAPKQ